MEEYPGIIAKLAHQECNNILSRWNEIFFILKFVGLLETHQTSRCTDRCPVCYLETVQMTFGAFQIHL